MPLGMSLPRDRPADVGNGPIHEFNPLDTFSRGSYPKHQ